MTAATFIFVFTLALAPVGVSYADNGEGLAAAETTYTCILAPVADLASATSAGASSVPVRDITGAILFYLPESYYLTNAEKITIFSNEAYKTSYANLNNIDFYVLTSDLGSLSSAEATFASGQSPYPNLLLQLKDDASLSLRQISPTTADNVSVSAADGYTIKFFGFNGDSIFITATKNDTILYGLAPRSDFVDFSVPLHPIAQAQRDALLASDDPSKDPAANTSDTLRVILIVGIIVPAVLIVILLFKPGKDQTGYDKHVMKKNKRRDDFDYDRDRRYSRDYDRDRDYRERDRDYDRRDLTRDRRDTDYPPRDERGYNDRRDRDGDYRDERF